MRTYAETTGLPWFILSAEHGLVSPDEWLEPYERYLPYTPRDYRRAWGQKVAKQLEQAVGSLAGLVVDVHAGAAYVEAVRAHSVRRALSWSTNCRGCRSAAVCRGTSSTVGLMPQAVLRWWRGFAIRGRL